MPAVPHDWSDPFLVQAKEDLRAAQSLVAVFNEGQI